MFPIYFEKEDIKRIALTFSIILICAGIIALIIWGKRGFPVTTHKINYQMHGFYVDQDGNVSGSEDFTVKGRALSTIKKRTYLELDFQMPVTFPYYIQGASIDSVGIYGFIKIGSGYFPYWITTDFTYNKHTPNNPGIMKFALCPEQEYFLFRASDAPDKYFVASTDPNTTAQEILDYFDSFIGTLQ